MFLGSSCIYPKYAEQPIKEDSLLSGKLEPTNEPYAIAKIAGIKLCESFNRQFKCDFRSIMPTNLYGPNDNFDLEKSHVLPALLRKMHLGKLLEDDDMDENEQTALALALSRSAFEEEQSKKKSNPKSEECDLECHLFDYIYRFYGFATRKCYFCGYFLFQKLHNFVQNSFLCFMVYLTFLFYLHVYLCAQESLRKIPASETRENSIEAC